MAKKKKKFDDTVLLQFSSSKASRSTTREYRGSIRGLRFGNYRPDSCRVVHVGKDFVLDEKATAILEETFHRAVNVIMPFPDPEVLYREWLDTIQRMQFVNRIGSGEEEV